MFRLDYPEYDSGQFSIEEASLDQDEIQFLPELKEADSVLCDPKFEEPFIKKHYIAIGRAGIPLRPYIRLMYLKHTNEWSYENLVSNVNESTSLRKFCRIPIDVTIPHSSTLARLTKKYGENYLRRIFQIVDKRIGRKNTNSKSGETSRFRQFLRSAADAIKKTIKPSKQ